MAALAAKDDHLMWPGPAQVFTIEPSVELVEHPLVAQIRDVTTQLVFPAGRRHRGGYRMGNRGAPAGRRARPGVHRQLDTDDLLAPGRSFVEPPNFIDKRNSVPLVRLRRHGDCDIRKVEQVHFVSVDRGELPMDRS